MNHEHLSEKDIQAIALDQGENDLTRQADNCLHCKAEVEKYRLLFSALKKQETHFFDFDLRSLVVSQLPEPRPGFSDKNILVFVLTIFGILIFGLSCNLIKDKLVNILLGATPMLTYLVITTLTGVLAFQIYDTLRKHKNSLQALSKIEILQPKLQQPV
jgi:hypothetical protein